MRYSEFQRSLDEAVAFRRLQKLASEPNRKLVEIARMLLTAEEAFQKPEPGSRQGGHHGNPEWRASAPPSVRPPKVHHDVARETSLDRDESVKSWIDSGWPASYTQRSHRS